jgi:magnesium chelatase accessory protein
MRPDWNREGRDWPNRGASSFVEAGGLRWHVQRMGQGPVLLLLHGTAAATHSWRALMPLLAERFTVIAPDLPGHGFTSAPKEGGYTLPAMAQSVAALLGEVGDTPAMTIGHSAGAAIAVRMALDGKLSGPIVSINGALLPFPGFAAQLFPQMARMLFLNPLMPRLFALTGQSEGFVRRFLERSTGSQVDTEGARYYQRLFACSGHCAAALAMMANWDLESLKRGLPTLKNAVALFAGAKDAAVPPSVADQVAALIPSGTVRKFERLGHLAHEEAPDMLAAAIIGQWVSLKFNRKP